MPEAFDWPLFVIVRTESWPLTEVRRFPKVSDELLAQTDVPPSTFEVEGRRRLGFDLHGPEDGEPCFWFHGSPSGRHEGLLLRNFGFEEGFRFIAVDRPGIGASDHKSGWTMLGFADDILALADHLGFEQFSVAGGSGGGPFVLAVAYRAKNRIKVAVSLACAGAFEFPDLKAQAGLVDRLATWAAGVPCALELCFGVGLRLIASVPNSIARLGRFAAPVPDANLPALLCRTVQASLAQGIAGQVQDTKVLHRPWGFNLEDIEPSITLVNGTKDPFIPKGYGEAIARRIPYSRLIWAQGDSHFQTIYDLARLRVLLRP